MTSATHGYTYIQETTSNLLRSTCIIINTHPNNHIYDHKQQYTNIIRTHTHTHTHTHRVICNSNINILLTFFFFSPIFFSAWWLSYKHGMKPVVADKHPCYQIYIYIKINIYLFRVILFIIELFASIKCFGFYIKPSSGHLMLYLLDLI